MQVTSVNIGEPQTIYPDKRGPKTGIHKLPVKGPARIMTLGLEGDFIASKKHHGGPDQAVYIYGTADYEWWSRELGQELDPGIFGENLTVSELESARFSIGDRLTVGEVILEVTAPRIPCDKFAIRMGDAQFMKRFREAERPGLYCRVIREGSVRAGDKVTTELHSGDTVTLLEIFRDFYEEKTNEAELLRFLRSPVAIRTRKKLEERLSKYLGEK
jgi:MOSC domain-containing protein YiiM